MLCFEMRIMTRKIAFHCLQWSSHLYNPFRIHSFHFKLCIYFLCMSPHHPQRHFTSLTHGMKKKTRKTAMTPPLKVISRKTTTIGLLMMEKQFDNKRQQYIYGWRDKNEEYGGSIGVVGKCVFKFFASQYFMDSYFLLVVVFFTYFCSWWCFLSAALPYDTSSYCHSCLLNFLFASKRALDGT